LLVRDGILTREDAVRLLSEQLSVAIANEDQISATGLVSALTHYGPIECLEQIRKAFTAELIDEDYFDLKYVEQGIAEGDARFQESLLRCRSTRNLDTVEEFRNWAAYRETASEEHKLEDGLQDAKREETFANQWEDDLQDKDMVGVPAVGTIQHSTPRVGRNDPCPCGSGKKFKKCCKA